MSFVKTFEEFKHGKTSSEIVEAKQSVTKQNPEEGELARWKVVLKASKEEDTKISEENEVQSALESLVTYDPFIDWWNNGKHVGLGGALGMTAQNEQANSTSIGFADKGSHRQAGFLLKEKAVVTFIFKQLVTDTASSKETKIFYNIDSAPWATAKVKGSNTEVYVWNLQNQQQMKFAEPKIIEIATKEASAQKIKEANLKPTISEPAKGDKTGGTSGTSGSTGSSVTSGTAGISGSTSAQAVATGSLAGVVKNPGKVDKKVMAIQQLIVDKGGDAAKKLLGAKPVDGRYGEGTAKALGLLINGDAEKPVADFNADAEKSLLTKLNVSADDLKKYTDMTTAKQAASTQAAQPKQSAPKVSSSAPKVSSSAPKTVPTKKGNLTF